MTEHDPDQQREAPEGAHDVNVVAIERAELTPDVAGWLHAINDQVEPRLARLNPGWREPSQAETARACAFGLLLGHLADRYPHMCADLDRIAETHPSFAPLHAGGRLAILRQLATQPDRAAAWIGPLIGLDDPERMRRLFE